MINSSKQPDPDAGWTRIYKAATHRVWLALICWLTFWLIFGDYIIGLISYFQPGWLVFIPVSIGLSGTMVLLGLLFVLLRHQIIIAPDKVHIIRNGRTRTILWDEITEVKHDKQGGLTLLHRNGDVFGWNPDWIRDSSSLMWTIFHEADRRGIPRSG